jgi:FtsH-binding integral membrane protein
MFDNKKRKETRLRNRIPDSVSVKTYNLIIGAMLLYGFVANAIMVATCNKIFSNVNPIVFLIGYFVSALIGSVMANASDNPIVSFIGYSLIVVPIGALLSICLPSYPMDLILSAIIVTAVVTALMMAAATIYPDIFAGMGPALLLSLIIGIIVELIASLMGYGGDIFNWFFIIVFSLYIGYDWHKAQAYPKTVDNAIDSSIDLYLDLINLFLHILEILGKKDD